MGECEGGGTWRLAQSVPDVVGVILDLGVKSALQLVLTFAPACQRQKTTVHQILLHDGNVGRAFHEVFAE
ncbi:MAG: hypothetical protein AAGA96_12685 [Verrucomicrobiota bacterium]